jgi:hypothetical protein
MARGIVLDYAGDQSSFAITKVERSKLYGRKVRIAVDEQGEPCSQAFLSADGRVVIPASGMAMVYVNDKFDAVDRADLVAVDGEGAPLPVVPSTLGVPVAVRGPVGPARLLDHLIFSVYLLTAETLSDALSQALSAGAIFEFDFSYRDGTGHDTAFLVGNDQGVFALIGRPSGFLPVSRAQVAVAHAEDAGDDEDDLDFSMI